MIPYYKMAIEKGNAESMYLLGNYYEKIENFDEMIILYIKSLEKGNIRAMNSLGGYYYKNKQIEFAIMCYSLAIKLDKNNTEALRALDIIESGNIFCRPSLPYCHIPS